MARAKANNVRSDQLADEAWAAGCRDVQAAINWVSARGEVPGRSFQAAYRRVLAAQDAGPPAPAGRDAGVTMGRGKRARPADTGGGGPDGPAVGGPAARPTPARAGRTADRPAREPGPTAEAPAVTPAEFVEDMRQLRRLVAKYGNKGLADLIGMLAG